MSSQEEEKDKGIVTRRVGEAAAGPEGKNYLLVIAIDEYAHCPQLNNCVKDAQDFITVLSSRYQFDPAYTSILKNAEATRANISKALKDLKDQVQPQDNLVVYFSGHGEAEEDTGYWVPVEAHPDADWEFVSTSEIKSRLDAIRSFHTFLVVDACFSGSLFSTFRSVKPGYESKPSRWGLAASHSRERALDGTPGENSPFAATLLKRLQESPVNLGVHKLATEVIDEVQRVTAGRQTPVFKPLNVKGDDSGQFVFHLKLEDEASFWEQVSKAGGKADYERYLDTFPAGLHTEEARRQIAALQEAEAWEQARLLDSVEGYDNYLDRYPNGRFASQAMEALDQKEEDEFWRIAQRKDSLAEYRKYLNKYPSGRYQSQSMARIGELQKGRLEPEAWQRAAELDTPESYRKYLQEYPDGAHTQEAKMRIEALEQESNAQKAKERDEEAWRKAHAKSSIAAYEQYLREFPSGLYAQQAKEWLNALREQKRAVEAKEAKERDEQAWSAAKAQATEVAYQAYLKEFPSGIYAQKAAAQIKALREQEEREATRRRDQSAWEQAKKQHTVAAYKGYLDQGFALHVAEAKTAILELEADEARRRDDAAWQKAEQANTRESYQAYLKAGFTLHAAEARVAAAGFLNPVRRYLAPGGVAVAALMVVLMVWQPWKKEPTLGNSDKQRSNTSEQEQLNTYGEDMVLVPGGTFQMGDVMGDKEYNNETVHSVTLSDFLIGKTEVTFEEYDAFCTATGRAKPGDEGWGRGKRPVINVSWEDAIAYCNWRSKQEGLKEAYSISGSNATANWQANGYRLPTEAEWEYAARQGGQKVRFGNGKNTIDPKEINFDASAGYKKAYSVAGEYRQKTVAVGSLNSPNALGLHDMSGNVWEWCWDWYGDYPSSAQTNPKGPSTGSGRVLRGGSWIYYPQSCRVARRLFSTPGDRPVGTGFRLARTL